MQQLESEENQKGPELGQPVSNYPRSGDSYTFADYRVLVDSCYELIGMSMVTTLVITCFQALWIQRYLKAFAVGSVWHEVVVAAGIGLMILFMYGLFAKLLNGAILRAGAVLGWSKGRSYFWIVFIILTAGTLVGSFLLLLLVDRFQRPLARAKVGFRVGAKKVNCLAEINAMEQGQKSLG